MVLAVGTVESVTVTTHTATYALHQAPFLDMNYYYYPEVRMQPRQFTVVWTDYNEPTSVTLVGFRTDNGQKAEKSYGVPQAPAWLFALMQEHLGEMGWKVLQDKGVQ
jgi:hypothetical protein